MEMNLMSENVLKGWSLFFGLLTVLLWSGCASIGPAVEQLKPAEPGLAVMMDTSRVFSHTLTGFMLYDPEQDSTLYAFREKNYFTPASNTKLYTFYTGLQLLPERVPALKYAIRGDSLIFWGTGDPSFLHPDLADSTVYRFLKGRKERLFYSDAHYHDELLGPGWSWADYNYYYSAEKSPFPIYGNVMRYRVEEIHTRRIGETGGVLEVNPPIFRRDIRRPDSTKKEEPLVKREQTENTFFYYPKHDTISFTVDIPFHYSGELVTDLLADTLGRPVEVADIPLPAEYDILYGIFRDTLFRRMLQPSDNFIAEQILLLISSVLGDTMNTARTIDYLREEHLEWLPDEPQWADGSGLSRYNLFTPRMTVALLKRIDREVHDELLFDLLPSGGETGTIESWYAHQEGGAPYVHAKTGTLRNNHCLSGFILTSSGRKLIFSFMNNNYTISTSRVKEEMEKLLWFIYETY